MKKVYIVDDDRNIVESLTMVLESSDYEVKSQFNQENVVENTAEYAPDLLILDVMFPEDDGAGFEMARDLRSDDRTKHIPILMLSAVNEKGIYAGTFSNRDRDDAFLPVDEFVEKPINPSDLLEKLQKLSG